MRSHTHWAAKPAAASAPATAKPPRSPGQRHDQADDRGAQARGQVEEHRERSLRVRSLSGAAAITAVNSDGYMSDMPTASATAPSQIDAIDPQPATSHTPTVTPHSAMDEPRRQPRRSGSRAPTMRTIRTSPAHSPNTAPTLLCPRSSA